MNANDKRYPKHACQFCGSEIKLVETVIDDDVGCGKSRDFSFNKINGL